ncbi:MAG: MEDS domain-containing protein [Chloroflexota bacterium]
MSRELDRQLTRLQHGDHLALIFESAAEQMATVVPFIKTGLERGELCLYVSDDQTASDIEGALSMAGVDVPTELQRGALLLLTQRESYLRGGEFDPELLFESLRQATQDALKAGFTGLRGAAEMTWLLSSNVELDALIRAEAMTNQFLPGMPVTTLCQYDRRRFSPQLLQQILRNHPIAILGDMLCPNLYYEPAAMVLGRRSDGERLEWMIQQLRRARAVEQGLEWMNELLEARVADRTAALAAELERRQQSAEERAALLVREQGARAEAERQAAQMNAILESLAEAVTVVDPAGRIVLRNRAACQITGLSVEAAQTCLLEGEGPLRRLDGTVLPREQWPTLRALRGEQVAGAEVTIQRPDGSTRTVLASTSTVRDSKGEVLLGVVTYRDVTELRHLEEMREEYVSLISHDLRNPLTALLGHSQFLQRQLARRGLEQDSHSVDLIVRNARRMSSMIQDLVESVRLESGYMDLQKEPTDILRLIHDVVEQLSSAELRHRIEIQSAGRLPPVAADPDRVARALSNLLGNALKYSPPESLIVVQVETRGREVVVCVEDQGNGIPSQEFPLLFQRFYRVRSGKSSEGLGLGLYITRLIAESHGGRVWVESQVGQGSRFYLALPIDTAPPIP